MKKDDVPFSHNIGVQSSDFEEARCFINSRIDDREVSPLSASGSANNLLTCQPLGALLSLVLNGRRKSMSSRMHSQPSMRYWYCQVAFTATH